MFHPSHVLRGAAVAIAAALLAAGCSESGTTSAVSTPAPEVSVSAASLPTGGNAPTPVPLPSGATIPQFSGPYAGDFAAAYQNSKSDLQRKVLADGVITEAEMSALQDAFRACVTTYGITNVSFDVDGSMSLKPPTSWTQDQVNAVVSECGSTTIDGPDLIFNELRRNPQHADEAELMAACLVRVGLAPAGYTAQDYRTDSPDNYPFDSKSDKFGKCVSDPVNAGR